MNPLMTAAIHGDIPVSGVPPKLDVPQVQPEHREYPAKNSKEWEKKGGRSNHNLQQMAK